MLDNYLKCLTYWSKRKCNRIDFIRYEDLVSHLFAIRFFDNKWKTNKFSGFERGKYPKIKKAYWLYWKNILLLKKSINGI